MKILALVGLLAAVVFLGTGCGSTPAYSPEERADRIARTWDIEGRQFNEDIDRALLLYPPSRLTPWNLR